MRQSHLLWIAVVACSPAPEQLPPLGEALVVVDTDAPVPGLVGRLRVDVYADDGTWLESRAVSRRDPSDFPVSFSVYCQDEGKGRTVLVRLRAYPTLEERDYRGERFQERPASGNPGDPAPAPPATGQPRLVQNGRDVTPAMEPLPNVTIDRLLRVRLEPGVRGSTRVVLHGACFGTMADLAGRTTCIDTENARVPLRDEKLVPDMTPSSKSVVGTFGASEQCIGDPRPATISKSNVPLFDDDVCAPGGVFILGSREGVGLGLLDSAPERVARIPPLFVDRNEVTVGRFHDALTRGFTPTELPVANNGPLAASSSAAHITRCTYSDFVLPGDENRESYPLNCVSWKTARSFCQWLGGDLLTEAQWEYVASASGRDLETLYPWGQDDPRCDGEVYSRVDQKVTFATACFDNGEPYGVAPLGTEYSGDVTPGLGIVGLGGGVMEWVQDAYYGYDTICWAGTPLDDPRCSDETSKTRMTRGGAWSAGDVDMLAAVRGHEGWIDTGYDPIGFRCARPGAGP